MYIFYSPSGIKISVILSTFYSGRNFSFFFSIFPRRFFFFYKKSNLFQITWLESVKCLFKMSISSPFEVSLDLMLSKVSKFPISFSNSKYILLMIWRMIWNKIKPKSATWCQSVEKNECKFSIYNRSGRKIYYLYSEPD